MQAHRQTYYREHHDDVSCLCIHPKGELVASGEVGARPLPYLRPEDCAVSTCHSHCMLDRPRRRKEKPAEASEAAEAEVENKETKAESSPESKA